MSKISGRLKSMHYTDGEKELETKQFLSKEKLREEFSSKTVWLMRRFIEKSIGNHGKRGGGKGNTFEKETESNLEVRL